MKFVHADRARYSPIISRPKLTLPNGARLALWVVPNIEHYEYLPQLSAVRDPWPRTPHPDIIGYGGKDYGNRVGVWRLIDLLDKHGIRGTVSLSIANFAHYPEILEACEQRGWSIMSHGMYNSRYHWDMAEDEERAAIQECIDLFAQLTGRKFHGWFSPAASYTLNTPDLIAKAGIKYYCDWYHDDQPAPVLVRSGQLISLPYTMDINDSVIYRQQFEGAEFAQMIKDAFDTLYREGADSARVMCIALHPYMMGQPHRIRHLDDALSYILSHDGVWAATGEEIADWYLEHGTEHMAALLGGGK